MTVETTRAPYAGWRALLATLLVLPAATGAHTWAGGQLPSWPGLALLGAVLLAASTMLLRHSVSWKLLLPAVAAAQTGLHTSFVALSGHALSGHALSGHDAHVAPGAPTPWSGRMLLAHAAVTLLTLLVWRLCERAATTVLRLLSLPPAYVADRTTGHPATDTVSTTAAAAVLLTAPRRGPPVGLHHA